MKLDNRGWGLREMLIYSSILLIFLLIAAFRISALYDGVKNNSTHSDSSSSQNNFNNSTDNNNNNGDIKDNSNVKDKYDLQYYYDYEDDMVEATQKYLKLYNVNIESSTKLDISTLIDLDLLGKLYDKGSTARCEGYVLIEYDNDKLAIKPFLGCLDYITKGY